MQLIQLVEDDVLLRVASNCRVQDERVNSRRIRHVRVQWLLPTPNLLGPVPGSRHHPVVLAPQPLESNRVYLNRQHNSFSLDES